MTMPTIEKRMAKSYSLFLFFSRFFSIFAKEITYSIKTMSNGIDFKPSKYQQAIYDYIEHGQGHLVVEAAAGSGKTTTLIKCLDFIPKDKKVLIVAFNKDIVRELEGRTKVYDNVDVRTLHSLGFLMLRRNYGERGLTPEEFKYESQMKANIRQYSSINPYSLKGRQYIDYFRNKKIGMGLRLLPTKKKLHLKSLIGVRRR